jgi:SAM-dependent methyltransferase
MKPSRLWTKAKEILLSQSFSHPALAVKKRRLPANSGTSPDEPENDAANDELRSNSYAFLDLGCGSGGSIDHCERRFDARPALGIDYTKSEVLAARAAGYVAYWCNFLDGRLPDKCVRFVSMMDALEHVRNDIPLEEVLNHVARCARDFLFIRHPSFESRDMADLAGLGLKIGWTDWSGHTNPLSIIDFEKAFAKLGWRDIVIIPHMFLHDTASPHIVPIECPTDTTHYDPAIHRPKPLRCFNRPIPGKFDIFVRLNQKLSDEEWNRISNIHGWEAT